MVMDINKAKQALSTVNDPELKQDLITLNMARDITIDGEKLSFTLVLTTPACPLRNVIEEDCKNALGKIGFKPENINIHVTSEVRKHGATGKESVPGVKQI